MYSWEDIARKVRKTKKQLSFALYCLPHGDDQRFVDSVKRIGKEYNVVSVEKGAEGGSNGLVYHIVMEPSGSGFFADFNKLLAYLYFADQMALIPVVEFSAQSRYAESHPVNGTSNPYEYYFMQPGTAALGDLNGLGSVIRSRRENVILAGSLNEQSGGYTKSEKNLDEMGRIFGKYIRFNETVGDMLRTDLDGMLGGRKTLGVHVRGTDFKWNYNGHPVVIGPEEYVQAAGEKFGKGEYEQIFLATDDLGALRLFQKAFGSRLCFYRDATRDDGTESVMNSFSTRENHHYLLGYEVLRDMYTLSSCEGLVAGLSQVSYAARICKRSREERYTDEVILDKGINYHQRYNCPK